MVIVYYNFTYGHLQIIQALLYQTNWRLQWCNGRDYHPCICRFAEVTDSKYIQCKFITSPFFNMNNYLTIFPPCPFIQIFLDVSWFYPDFIQIKILSRFYQNFIKILSKFYHTRFCSKSPSFGKSYRIRNILTRFWSTRPTLGKSYRTRNNLTRFWSKSPTFGHS